MISNNGGVLSECATILPQLAACIPLPEDGMKLAIFKERVLIEHACMWKEHQYGIRKHCDQETG
jgi:hypothetical protein